MWNGKWKNLVCMEGESSNKKAKKGGNHDAHIQQRNNTGRVLKEKKNELLGTIWHENIHYEVFEYHGLGTQIRCQLKMVKRKMWGWFLFQQ